MHLALIGVLLVLFLGPSLWIGYQAWTKVGWGWMLLLLPIAWLTGVIFGAIAAMYLVGVLEWVSNLNTPPAGAGSMGGVAWLGIWLVAALIISPFCAAIFTWLAAKFFLNA